MGKWIRRLVWLTLISLILFFLVRVYFNMTDDFRLSNISYEMPNQPSWDIAAPTPVQEKEINEILGQQFSYLGKGAQSYAFVSDDGRYVIKFFKFKHLRPSWFHAVLPSVGVIKEFKETQAARKRRKLYGVFQGYKLAYDTHKKESGLIFIQLNIHNNPKRTVIVRDKIGLKRRVDLQHIPFILQDKGQTLRVVIADLLNKGDVAGAKQRLGQIFKLYRQEYNKGIYDHDHGVMQNTGFVGDEPIHLDVGKLVREESMKDPNVSKKDLALVAGKMKTWIQTNYPQYDRQLSAYIDNDLKE